MNMNIQRGRKKSGRNGDIHLEGGFRREKDVFSATSVLKGKVSFSQHGSVLKNGSHGSDVPHVSKDSEKLNYVEEDENTSLSPAGVVGQQPENGNEQDEIVDRLDCSREEEEENATGGDAGTTGNSEKNDVGSKIHTGCNRERELLMEIERLKTDMRRKLHAVGKKRK